MKVSSKYQKEDFLQFVDQYTIDELVEFSHTIKTLFIFPKGEERNDILGVFKVFFTHIDVVSTGEEALELFSKNRYDFIMISTDINDINPTEVIERIRKISRSITVLALSHENKYFLDFVGLGIEGFLLHPIDVNKYVKIMTKIIDTMLNKQRLYEYRINLEDKVKEKTKELTIINAELEDRIKEEVEKNRKQEFQLLNQAKNASMGEMIGNIAHQWRQPLSAITSTASSVKVQNELNLNTPEDINKNMDDIIYKANYLSETINIFRDFLSDDKEIDGFILENTIQKSLQIVSSSLVNNNIEIQTNIDFEYETCLIGIEGELSQVIINILNNAKDILKTKANETRWIQINLEHRTNKAILSIEDNGGGIPLNILSKIFDPYFTTKHKSQGTGLGLHISYIIIKDSYSGELYVKNTEHGAKFYMELPL
jgi:C4-dicarboxylate-specific signal transduction histidine kinase